MSVYNSEFCKLLKNKKNTDISIFNLVVWELEEKRPYLRETARQHSSTANKADP